MSDKVLKKLLKIKEVVLKCINDLEKNTSSDVKIKAPSKKTCTKKFGRRIEPKVKEKIVSMLGKGWTIGRISTKVNVSVATIAKMKKGLKDEHAG